MTREIVDERTRLLVLDLTDSEPPKLLIGVIHLRAGGQASVIVNMLAIPRVQPGCEIEVRIDPQDRSKVAIDEKLTYLGYS